mmetsp:Transcript_48303/g.149193  ORF Transcript_48303/g.149193 Transcript_48303/m.149193 type:complete len:419 (-) Transcript_48303:120-1376(-)|eukprot:CAMPEP_0204582418 /NCGR_PEP_ID=MMETSP0661-20131031/45205_1 /ASSEMBLY_ACC=CAM_ASM_000606 /TAXON_ID=109239 /ORGANISM="Alexandrium margalefi, Strain AMGDE01CS-322" /LENGTH=418 /DNA_ID=CAMNT_0051591693 /DNA_START=66 /DNA_END=1322 /DNA_ORIENTATION=+
MARGRAWYAALHLAYYLAVSIEMGMLAVGDAATASGTVSPSLANVLLFARGINVLALGLAFDRFGPRACFASSTGACLAYMLGVNTLGVDAVAIQVIRVFARPMFGLAALGLQDCAYEDRPGFIAHLHMNFVLASTMHTLLFMTFVVRGGLVAGVGLNVVYAALSWRLTRPDGAVATEDGSAEPARAAGGKQPLPAHSLPTPTPAASTWAHEGVGRLLARPEVYTVLLLDQAVAVLEEVRYQATVFANADRTMTTIDGLFMRDMTFGFLAVFLLVWTCGLGRFINRFGPSTVIQSILKIMVLTDLVAFLSLLLPLPPVLLPLRRVQLQLCLVILWLAGCILRVVGQVYAVGVVSPGERGTLLSLMMVRDGALLLQERYEVLYRVCGFAGIRGLCSAGSIGVLLMFRRSPLPHFRLKQT